MPAAEEKCNELRRLYHTIKDFMLANSPDRQLEVCKNPDKCHFGNSPTLSQLNACYGETAAEAWLVPQLYELSEFEGLKGQADRHQLAKTAKIVSTEFYFLKTDELLLFFYRFSAGRYASFTAISRLLSLYADCVAFSKNELWLLNNTNRRRMNARGRKQSKKP